MNIGQYDYEYPESAIALHPPKVRGQSKLFVVDTHTGGIVVDLYEHLDRYLFPTDTLVRNITRVFHARLFATAHFGDGSTVSHVEVFITEPHAQTLDEYATRQYVPSERGFLLQFLTPLKRKKMKSLSHFSFEKGLELVAIRIKEDAYEGIFRLHEGQLTVEQLFDFFAKTGKVPLPPYIKRNTVELDESRYQTIFAQHTGSVAAPTASLNFTSSLESRLRQKNVQLAEVTLHVGRGTFLPLRNEIIEENVLHSEPFFISEHEYSVLSQSLSLSRRIIAMGTTVVRTLESVSKEITAVAEGKVLTGETNLFIYPPFQFSVVSGLLTNFHFPKSSLITLVDAFLQWKKCPITWRDVYGYAIEHNAKLFSYGDSMLVL